MIITPDTNNSSSSKSQWTNQILVCLSSVVKSTEQNCPCTSTSHHNILNKIYSPTHRTPGPPVEVGVVRDHGGRHGAPDLDIRVGEDVAAPQPPASAPRPLVLGVKPDLVTPGVTGAEVTGLGGYLDIVQGLSLLRGP